MPRQRAGVPIRNGDRRIIAKNEIVAHVTEQFYAFTFTERRNDPMIIEELESVVAPSEAGAWGLAGVVVGVALVALACSS